MRTIDPHQFLGMEFNPRAAAIAELVLWIGYLQWHIRTRGGFRRADPAGFKNIEVQDAVLAWDGKDLARDEAAGRERAERAIGSKFGVTESERPEWPAADFIVGNPPFIGARTFAGALATTMGGALGRPPPYERKRRLRDVLVGSGGRSLTRKGTRLRRFGLVTTNSLSQVFQRRVIERHLDAKNPVSIMMAIPDHPWTKATAKRRRCASP